MTQESLSPQEALAQSGDHAPLVQAPFPTLPEVCEGGYKPENDLMATRQMRGRIIGHIAGKGVPDDKGMLMVLLTTLDHQDKQALAIVRAKLEQQSADGEESFRQAALAMMNATRDNAEYGLRKVGTQAGADISDATLVPTLDETLLPTEEAAPFVEGELSTAISPETFASFKAKHADVVLADQDEED